MAATLPEDIQGQKDLLGALLLVIGPEHPCRSQIASLLKHIHAVERRDRAQLALNDEFKKLLGQRPPAGDGNGKGNGGAR